VKIWIADRPGAQALGRLPADVEVTVFPANPIAHADLVDVEFLVPPFGDVDVLEVLPRMRRLRVVQTLEAGVDWIVNALPPGVTLCNARGAHESAVAEWVVGAILMAQRGLHTFVLNQARKCWSPALRQGHWAGPKVDELQGKTVLIIGYGGIGAAVEHRLVAFGVSLLRIARRARGDIADMTQLDRLLGQADIVVVLVPLTGDTKHLVDAAFLEKMRPGALLVNVGRGPVVDTQALLSALHAGHIRAALDVTDPEPLPTDHPLWSAPGVLISPHTAADTPERFDRSWRLVCDQVLRYRAGEPLGNVVATGAVG
jgi:phosphoglycerate dehydrogenase-like enzyme